MLDRLRDRVVIGSYQNIHPVTVTVKRHAKIVYPERYCDVKMAQILADINRYQPISDYIGRYKGILGDIGRYKGILGDIVQY